MQMTEFQMPFNQTSPEHGRGGDSSNWAGCISKKQISAILRPHCTYRSRVVRNFFTSERLERCGIRPDEFPHIRDFSVEATFIIVSDLKKYGFLK